jgi:tetratricopeptide (TPR) repeat protein
MILENPTVRSFQYFIDPSKAKAFQNYPGFVGRYVGYLTFASNYYLHGLDVRGYHLYNLIIHIVNAFLVYLIVLLTFSTQRMKESALAAGAGHVALFSALLFVSHPVQTQAVTYIIQRFASLAACFYLASLACYIIARLSAQSTPQRVFYALSFISAVLAMKTKETAFTLPLAIALYEWMFFRGEFKRRFLRLVPLLLTMLIIPLSFISLDSPEGEIIKDVEDTTRISDVSRTGYLLTEFRVVVTYIRLLFFPVNQNLDYDYPVSHSLFEPPVFLSFLFLICILGLGIYLLGRSRTGDEAGRFAAFGVFWFFLALSVESTLIPLHVIFEHRVYLPSAGAFWALGIGAYLLVTRLRHKWTRALAVSSMFLVPLVLSYAAYERNKVWGTERGLWEDVVSKSPNKARGHSNLGNAYEAEGQVDVAVEHFNIALELDPDNEVTHYNLGNAYRDKGLPDKAIEQYLTAVRLKPDYAEAHNNLGNVYRAKGSTEKALEHLEAALKLKPYKAEIHYNLGNAYVSEGLTERAIEHYDSALRLKPDYVSAHNNIAAAYLSKNMVEKAVEHYRAALGLNPGHVKAHYNLGLIHFIKGDMDAARREFQAVLWIDPENRDARRYLEGMK